MFYEKHDGQFRKVPAAGGSGVSAEEEGEEDWNVVDVDFWMKDNEFWAHTQQAPRKDD